MRPTLCLLLTFALCGLSAVPAAADERPEAPAFELTDVNGETHALSDVAGKWVVLEWVNYDCPFVKKLYDESHRKMQSLQSTYTAKGVVWLSICSSAEGKQGHLTPEAGRQALEALGAAPTALLLDPEGTVGRLYGARTTPDMRIIDPKGKIVYAGAIDDTRSTSPEDVATAKNYVEVALDALLAGGTCPVEDTRPYGCSVKYAPKKEEPALPKAPAFALPDVDGTVHELADYRGKWVVLEWVNYDCPFVKKQYHRAVRKMQSLQSRYAAKGVVWLSICSSAPGKQGYMTSAQGKRRLQALGASPAALLLDPDGKVGRLYGARTTPDMRIINPRGELVYAGAIDDKRSADPRDVASSTNYVEQVLDAVLAGEDAPVARTRPYGCSVKYAR